MWRSQKLSRLALTLALAAFASCTRGRNATSVALPDDAGSLANQARIRSVLSLPKIVAAEAPGGELVVAVDATTNSVISASASTTGSAAFRGVSLAVEAGALAGSGLLFLAEAEPLATSQIASEIGVTSLASASPAVLVTGEALTIAKPLVIALPIAQTLSLSGEQLGVLGLIPGNSGVSSLEVLSDQRVVISGQFVYAEIDKFGAYQVVKLPEKPQKSMVATSTPATKQRDGGIASKYFSPAYLVDSVSQLPPCNAARDGQLFYIKASKQFQTCDGRDWAVIELTGPQGVAGERGSDGAKGDTGVLPPYVAEAAITTKIADGKTVSVRTERHYEKTGGPLLRTCITEEWDDPDGTLNGSHHYVVKTGDTGCPRSTLRETSCKPSFTLVDNRCEGIPHSLTYGTDTVVLEKGTQMAALSPTIQGGYVSSFAVTPALPEGLAFNPVTGTISGTPKGVVTSATYKVHAGNTLGVAEVSLDLAVRDRPPAIFSYDPSALTLTKGLPTADGWVPQVQAQGGGMVTAYAVTPSLPAGLTFAADTGRIRGTPSTLQIEASEHIISAANSGGTTTTQISVRVIDVPPTALAYSAQSVRLSKSVPAAQLAPSHLGGAVTKFFVSPQLPLGLVLDESTGVISGTPLAMAPKTTFTITAENSGGTASAQLELEVGDAPPTLLGYPKNSFSFTKGVAVQPIVPRSEGGTITQFSVTPSLPAGLTIDPTTGSVQGLPLNLSHPASAYRVVGSNESGLTFVDLQIAIVDLPPEVSYPALVFEVGAPAISTPILGGGSVTGFSVDPTLPAGLTLNPESGVIAGTPVVLTTPQTYTVTAVNSGGASAFALQLRVNDIKPSNLAYASLVFNAVKGQSFSSGAPTSHGGSVVIFSVTPNLPSGLILDPASGVISGIATELKAATAYTVTASNSGGSTATSVVLASNPPPPSNLSYPTIAGSADKTLTVTKGANLAPVLPTNDGSYITQYEVNPDLPNGISLNPVTGAIYGAPTEILLPSRTFRVTGSNVSGSTYVDLQLRVIDVPPVVTYPSMIFDRGVAAHFLPTTSGGQATQFTITPQLPLGLNINPNTGEIHGTAIAVAPRNNYTVTATNSGGTSTPTLELTVNEVKPSNLTYGAPEFKVIKDTNFTSSAPSYDGGLVISYSIDPALPLGLHIDATTGVIYGNTTEIHPAATYTVTASNSGGSATTIISLAVNPPAPSRLSYADSSYEFYKLQNIDPIAPTESNGIAVIYSVQPALPTGLSLDISTGTISGQPTGISDSSSYTIKAQNVTGFVTATLQIAIVKIVPLTPAPPIITRVSPYSTRYQIALQSPADDTRLGSNPVVGHKLKIGSTAGASDVAMLDIPTTDAQTFIRTGAENTTYHVSVCAVDSVGTESSCSSASDPLVIGSVDIPTPLTPSVPGPYVNTGTATFEWLMPDYGEDSPQIAGYNVEVANSPGGASVFIGFVPDMNKSVPVVEGLTYYARVQAVTHSGRSSEFSSWSSSVSVDKAAPATPAAPTAIFYVTRQTRFSFNWTAPTDNAGGSGIFRYNLKIGTTPGGADIYSGTETGLSKEVIGINGVVYYASVQAVDRAGNVSAYSPSSPQVIVDTTSPPQPAAPTTPNSLTNSGSVTFYWTTAADNTNGSGIASYNLQVGTSPGASDVFNGNVTTLERTVTLTNAPSYYARIQAVDKAGNLSAFSPSSTAVSVDLTSPTVGGGGLIMVSNVTNSAVNLNWSRGTDNASMQSNLRYFVYYSPTDNIGTLSEILANGTPFGSGTFNTTSATVTGLSPNSSYFFNIIVQDQAGNRTAYQSVNGDTSMSTPWTWTKGSSTGEGGPIYGTFKVGSASNTPGARRQGVSWTDASGGLWLFGGALTSGGTTNYYNDLWKFDGTNWIWCSGSQGPNLRGTYGTMGVGNTVNVPGARMGAVSWRDSANRLWLFGGYGYSANGSLGYLSDLWRFDGSQWTWVSGSNSVNTVGAYGSKGISQITNAPGARMGSVSWTNSSNELWLFGGTGFDQIGNLVSFNDLWKFDGIEWTWMSGSDMSNQAGTYGTKGIGSSTNAPGARHSSVAWVNSSGHLFLYGGYGYDSNGLQGKLNDLWKFTGSSWTWIAGDSTRNNLGAYGQKGMAAVTNLPGARDGAMAWADSSGNFWLFGGSGFDNNSVNGVLNDLWRFDGTNWTWISGSTSVNQLGSYGVQGSPGSANVPGSRNQSMAWIDGNNMLWLFGGFGYDQAGNIVHMNDLWRGKP